MGKKIYEEGHMAAKKAPCDHKLLYTGKMRETNLMSADGNTDISQCIELLGREIQIEVPSDVAIAKKTAQIIMLYSHMVLAVYKAGKENEYEFKVGISVAELVEKGLLTFEHGYPEVVSLEKSN